MIQLRYYNNKLQQQDQDGFWYEVPVVKDEEHPKVEQCAKCGVLYVNNHDCWI